MVETKETWGLSRNPPPVTEIVTRGDVTDSQEPVAMKKEGLEEVDERVKVCINKSINIGTGDGCGSIL